MTRTILLGVVVACAMGSPGAAQDLYDTGVLRTLNFTFQDPDWLTLLEDNYASETNILADLEVDGTVYPDVGVRIRGNTSYTALPAGSEKFSLNVEVDFVHADQEVMGYDSLNLNNGFRDPTFCREVMYNNYVAQFIPNPRANHVLVTLNGQNWGVYVNVQQFDKTMLSTHFPDTDGLRIKCPNNPFGPGLRYNGPDASGYSSQYEIKNDGGLTDPWGALIEVCDAVTNTPLGSWESIDSVFAIDPSIWSVVLENLLTDDDSYVNKGADFMIYRNPVDARTFLLQTDANETFTEADWSVTHGFSAFNKPFLSHVLDVPELRQRYMAHLRTIQTDLSWAYFEPTALALRDQIDAHVQADPKKIYTYQQFLDNFTTTVFLSGGGPFGGSLPGIQEFVEDRATFLAGHAELNASGPTIESVVASDDSPDPAEAVTITAVVTPNGSPVGSVELFYRPSPSMGYERVPMVEGAPGEFAVDLPVTPAAGLTVEYYVGATAMNAWDSWSFLPARTEWAPRSVDYTFGSTGGMRVTEWAYSADSGEFVEFTNLGVDPVDLTGWSFDDDHREVGAFDLSGFGVVAPGESVVLTEATATDFRAAWGLDASVKVVGELGVLAGHNLGRNDEINLFDDLGNVIDRLTYGDQTFPGSIRTQDASGQACADAIGQDDVFAWVLSEAGDGFGSYPAATAEPGTPGVYGGCLSPVDTFVRGDANGDGNLDIADPVHILAYLFTSGPSECEDAQDVNDDGGIDIADAIYGLAHQFSGGPEPLAPFPTCGEDPTTDGLDPTCPPSAACP